MSQDLVVLFGLIIVFAAIAAASFALDKKRQEAG